MIAPVTPLCPHEGKNEEEEKTTEKEKTDKRKQVTTGTSRLISWETVDEITAQ